MSADAPTYITSLSMNFGAGTQKQQFQQLTRGPGMVVGWCVDVMPDQDITLRFGTGALIARNARPFPNVIYPCNVRVMSEDTLHADHAANLGARYRVTLIIRPDVPATY